MCWFRRSGLRETQLVAVALNVIAGVGALSAGASAGVVPRDNGPADARRPIAKTADRPRTAPDGLVAWTGLALLLSGFAAMGMEILWLRHFTLLLGGFRAVFSLLLTIMLAGIGAGVARSAASSIDGRPDRRRR